MSAAAEMNWRTFYKNFYPEFQSVAFSNGEFLITNRYFLIDFKNGKKQLIIKRLDENQRIKYKIEVGCKK